jgi:hypothetical protein
MDPTTLIPAADAIPVAWGWMEFFILLTFVLHLLFMNTMLGMAGIALIDTFRKNRPDSMAEDIGKKLPYTIAFTINMGVAPLLFLQVIYGHFMYVSTILMAGYWMAILLLLMIAYYGAYIYDFKYSLLHSGKIFLMSLVVCIFLIIGFLFTNNMTMMLQPETWVRYFDESGGTLLNLSDPVLWPRYLHFMVASFAVGGLFMALVWSGKSRRDMPGASGKVRRGMRWFTHTTLVQIGIGLWFLIALPRNIMLLFMGDSGLCTGVFLAGILLTVVSLVFGFKQQVMPTVISATATIVVMAIMRDFVRSAYLEKYFTLSSLKVVPQYSPMFMFLITLVGGLFVVFILLKWAAQAGREVTS